jgi:DNA-binding response OmpR family regulator
MKILTVEEDVYLRVFLERALLTQRYSVERAANGVQALGKTILKKYIKNLLQISFSEIFALAM